MQVDFDFEKMEQLLRSFHIISNVRYSLADTNNNLLCVSSEFSAFCHAINSDEEGHCRCKQCDAIAMAHASQMQEPYYTYRCHAGLLETVLPIRQYGEVIAFLFFGQMIEADDPAAQWEDTLARLSWLPGAEGMQDAFFKLQHMHADTVKSCADVLNACSSYICMEGVIRSASMSDEQQLRAYIARHYTERLTLDRIAHELSMSKTKLCGIAARQGDTVMNMLNTRRMEEAKRLLRNNSDRVSEIACAVGVHDCNYFSKLFKTYTGETPRDYQQRFRRPR